ncbi:hypothetical protein BST81_00880 [Leptolyngbya sp. 'hensonii']|nr:hypothetical protein BST81_00880 [Leptolyngbya sp. 'hensonii']
MEQTVGRLLVGKTPTQLWDTPLRILEPACGTGVFLVRAYQYLLDWFGGDLPPTDRVRILLDSLYGVDIDPIAVEATRWALVRMAGKTQNFSAAAAQAIYVELGQNLKSGNAVIGPDCSDPCRDCPLDWEREFPAILQAGGFDAVIGNPPFLDAELMVEHWPEQRRYCASHYRTASGNWDLFCVFIEKAIALCKPGGFTSLVVPNKLGSARYAAPARQLLALDNQLLSIRDYSMAGIFPASVYPIVYVTQKQPPQAGAMVRVEQVHPGKPPIVRELACDRHFKQPERPWPIFAGALPLTLLDQIQTRFPMLGSIAEVCGAATVGEAYQLQPLLQEAGADAAGALPVVNSGTIDRYHLLWGQKPFRYLGQRYQRPVLERHRLQVLSPRRQEQVLQPKIIVAGMSKILECGVDLAGQVLAGKSTTIVRSSLNLLHLLGLLNSRLLTLIYQSLFGGDRLQGGYLRIGPPQLRALPIWVPNLADPIDQQHHETLIRLVERMLVLQQEPDEAMQPEIDRLDQAIDHLVCSLYGLTEAETATILEP